MKYKNISMGAGRLTDTQVALITPRLRERMDGWSVHYPYKGYDVSIPGSWGGVLYPFQYSEIYKTADSEDNPGEEESNIQLMLGLGWPSCDFEVIIALRIPGVEVFKSNGVVHAEILKLGAADMVVKHRGKFVTDFTQYALWGRFFKVENGLATVEVP